MCCALLRCGSSRPLHQTPGRTDLDLKLELPSPVARPDLAAIETRGALDQLELKIRFSSAAGRLERSESVEQLCVVLRRGLNRPGHPSPDRIGLGIPLELPGRTAPEPLAAEARGALSQLDLERDYIPQQGEPIGAGPNRNDAHREGAGRNADDDDNDGGRRRPRPRQEGGIR